jgi:hypothetical protein
MKYREERPFADIEVGLKKLLDLANAIEADPAGRISIGPVNRQFLDAGASVPEYKAALGAAIDRGYVTLHPSAI